MSNTLIVGGAGYIGGAVTDLLPQARVYDNLLYEPEYRKGNTFILGDIRDRKKLKEHLAWADAVIWLAAIVGDGACAHDPELTYELNTASVRWLSENFNGRIIFPSTCSVYGAQDGILDETSPTNPLSVYASSKLQAEQYLKNKNACIFRLGTVFGVSDQFSRVRLDLVVNTMTAKAYTEGKLKVFGGEQYRPLIHVKDIAEHMVETIDSQIKGMSNLATYNYRIGALAEKVAMVTNAEIETVAMKFEDNRNYQVKRLCTTDRNIVSGIKEILDVMPRIKDPNSSRYSNSAYIKDYYANN